MCISALTIFVCAEKFAEEEHDFPEETAAVTVMVAVQRRLEVFVADFTDAVIIIILMTCCVDNIFFTADFGIAFRTVNNIIHASVFRAGRCFEIFLNRT